MSIQKLKSFTRVFTRIAALDFGQQNYKINCEKSRIWFFVSFFIFSNFLFHTKFKKFKISLTFFYLNREQKFTLIWFVCVCLSSEGAIRQAQLSTLNWWMWKNASNIFLRARFLVRSSTRTYSLSLSLPLSHSFSLVLCRGLAVVHHAIVLYRMDMYKM